MQRLLFVISSLDSGGAQRALSNIVTNLSSNWDIDILLSHTEVINYPYRGNIISLNLREPNDRTSLLYQFCVTIKRFFILLNLKKQKKYTACISFLASANIVNILTGNKYSKTIISIRSDYRYEGLTAIIRFVNIIENKIYKKADIIIPVSESIREHFINKHNFLPSKLKTIYNGYNLNNYIKNRVNPINGSKDAVFTFITTGRLSQQKGHWHLIRVFAQLVKKHPNCELCILGEGPLRPYLEMLVSGYNIKNNVHLPGFVNDTLNYYQQPACFVLSSLYEGLPNVVIEAMMCGMPIISCDCFSGPREILAPGTDINHQLKEGIEYASYGLLVPVCSGIKHNVDEPLEYEEQVLLSAMEIMLTQDDMRQKYKDLSIQRSKDFSIENIIKQWEQVINDTCSK